MKSLFTAILVSAASATAFGQPLETRIEMIESFENFSVIRELLENSTSARAEFEKGIRSYVVANDLGFKSEFGGTGSGPRKPNFSATQLDCLRTNPEAKPINDELFSIWRIANEVVDYEELLAELNATGLPSGKQYENVYFLRITFPSPRVFSNRDQDTRLSTPVFAGVTGSDGSLLLSSVPLLTNDVIKQINSICIR
jgi:hypothetical protein